MSKEEEYLRYGQIIRIHGNETGDKRGLIAVKGFTQLDARYIPFEQFRNIEFYRQGLFQVLPRGVFEIHDEVQRSMQEKKKKDSDGVMEGGLGKPKELQREDEDAEQIALNQRLEGEKEQYEQIISTKTSELINFGDDVIFKHVDSGAYLSGSVRCSEGGLGSFKVELSDSLSSILVFKLLPFRSYEKEGDPIKLLGPIRIKNIENRCYLSREEIQQETSRSNMTAIEPRNSAARDYDVSQILRYGESTEQRSPTEKRKKTKRFNIVTTYSQSETWLIHLHEGHETLQDKETIRTHDLIYLRHTQHDGYLASSLDSTTYLKELNDNEYDCYSCIWQIEFLPLPRIKPPMEQDCGRDETYCLRDILTSRQLKLTEDSDRSTEVRIVNAKGSTSEFRLRNKDLVKIYEIEAERQQPRELDVGEEFNMADELNFMKKLPYVTRKLKLSSNDTEHGFRVIKIDDETKKEVLLVLSTYEVLKDFAEHLEKKYIQEIEQEVKAKKLELVDSTLCKLIAFVKNCSLEEIDEQILPKEKNQMILKDLEISKIIFDILQKMGCKIRQEIYKQYKKENELFKTVFNRCYSLILQMIRNNPVTKLYVAEGWLQIILRNAIQIEEHNSHVALNEILRSNYAVVDEFLKDSLLSQILEVFILKPPHEKFLNILRNSCICNGKPMVKNQNTVLKHFFETLEDNITFKFIPEDRSLNESIDMRGTLINPPLMDTEPNNNKYKVKIRSCISKSMEENRALDVLFAKSEQLDCQQTWNYFLAFLNLLADICFGRNSKAKNFVEQLLTKDLSMQMKEKWARDEDLRIPVNDRANQSLYILCLILEDDDIHKLKSNAKDALRAILRLINYAFVDTVKQNPIVRLSRLRNYNTIENGVEINRTPITEDNKLLQKVMTFLQRQIEKFRSFQSADIKEKHFLETVLDLLKSSLISGYWQKYEEMLDMLKSLLRILKNQRGEIYGEEVEEDKNKTRKPTREEKDDQDHRFNIYKAEAKKPTPEVQLIIKCKMLACDLIRIILDFRTDLRVSHCTLIFKNIVERPAQFAQYATDQDRDVTIGSDTESIISFEDGRRQKSAGDDLDNPGIWNHEMAEVMKERDELKYVTTDDMNLNLIMMELSIYEDPALIASSLTILKRIHQRLTQIMLNFTGVGLLADEATETLINAVAETRKKMTILDDENLLSTTEEDTENGLVAELAWMARACKLNFQLQGYRREPESTNNRRGPGFSLFQVFTERDDVHSIHQRLIKCLDIHYTLLRFINMCHGKETQQLAKNLLRSTYCFLVMLTKHNLEMKFEIAPSMDVIRSSIGKDIGALELLYELYSNNKNNLYKEKDVEQLTEEICQLIQNHRVEDIYKSKLMHFFHCLIYYNEDVIKSNQGAILAKLQDSKKTKIYFKVDDTSDSGLNRANIERWVGDFELRGGANHQLQKRQSMGTYSPEPRSALRRKATIVRDVPSLNQLFEVDLPPQLMYYITMFNTFSSLIEGDNQVNIGKCKQVHSYKFLLDLLGMPRARSCYPLRRNLRAYINRLYYSDNDYENLSEHIIKTEIPLIIDDLDLIIRLYLEQANMNLYSLSHPVRFQYFETYYYLYFEEVLVTLHEILHKERFKDMLDEELTRNYARGNYYLHYEIMRIFERLRYLSNKYNNRFVKSFIRTVTNKIRSDYLERFIVTAIQIFNKNEQSRNHTRDALSDERVGKSKKGTQNEQKRIAALKIRSEVLLHELEQGLLDKYFKQHRVELQQNYPLTFHLPETDPSSPHIVQTDFMAVSDEQRRTSLALKLRRLITPRQAGNQSRTVFYNGKLPKLKKLLTKPSFQLYLEGEFNKGCTDLFRIDQNSMETYQFKIPFVSLQQYILTIVRIVKKKRDALSIELKIFFFRILRRYIEERNTNHDGLKSVDEWNNNDWEGDRPKLESAQKFLNESGIPELLIESLSHHEDLQLDNEIILFGIAFILGGNKDCQDSILKMLKKDKQNHVFLNIQALIVELGKTIENFNKIKTVGGHSTSSFNFRLIDDYDSFHTESRVAKRKHTIQPPGPHEIRLKELSSMVFKRVFRFLQLLCENDHQANKKYFLEQVDENEQRKLNSINMIEQSTFEIRKLFKIMSKDIVALPLSVLDFINEINQIPCEDNQKTLCKTTFFEDFCYMASYLSDQENLKERRFVKIQGMNVQYFVEPLSEIYIKCINIVICVLEGNDESIYRELATKLQNKFLMDIIKKNLGDLGVDVEKEGSDEEVHRIINDDTEFLMKQSIVNALNVLIIIKKIGEFEKECKLIKSYELYLKQNRQMERIHLALGSYILKIEIKSNNKKQTVYFPKHPILTQLSDETRDRIMMAVRRETHTEKLVSLFEFKEEIFDEIKHNFTISKKDRIFGFRMGTKETQTLFDWSLRVSMLINVLWLIFSNVIIEYQEIEFGGFVRLLNSALAVVQVVLTALYVVAYVNSKAVLAKCRAIAAEKDNMAGKKQESSQDVPQKRQAAGPKMIEAKPSVLVRILSLFSLVFTRLIGLLSWMLQLAINVTPEFIKKFFYYLKVLLVYDTSFRGTLAYAVISLLGLFYSHHFFLLHQIFIFTKIEALDNVFQAVMSNPQQLISVSLLGVVFLFVFCMLSYETYAKNLHENPESQCDTILDCVINLYVSGTLGGGMEQFEPLKFLYDMAYSVFFGILFSNIIGGIMTDSLAELRANREDINTDKNNTCYICGIDRATLQKSNIKFSNHTRKDHFLWNYIFYLYCLEQKDQMDKSGLEYEISRCAQDPNDISWIPAHEDNSDDSEKKIEQLKEALQQLQEISQKKVEELNKINLEEL